jgi:hypothetical protein
MSLGTNAWAVLPLGLSLSAGACAQEALLSAQQLEAWAPHRAVKVLYAGSEGGHRERAFGAFLEQWFDTSATLPLEKLSMATAADFDVVIVDWVSQYGNDGYEGRENRLFGAPITLGPDFTKPLVAMTYVGTQVRREYKLDWL